MLLLHLGVQLALSCDSDTNFKDQAPAETTGHKQGRDVSGFHLSVAMFGSGLISE